MDCSTDRKENSVMGKGDFVAVHFPDGCIIGRFLSDDGRTVSVVMDSLIGRAIVTDIPKERVTLHVSIHTSGSE